jgi:hypothetical protein
MFVTTYTKDQLNAKYNSNDILYGYTKQLDIIGSLAIPRFISCTDLSLEFWGVTQTRQIESSLLPGYYNSRKFKAALIDVVARGNRVISILNGFTDDPHHIGSAIVGTHTISFGREISTSELGFIARYWDMFFKNHVDFYYFDASLMTFTASQPLWELPSFPNWRTYYELNFTKNKRLERRQRFQEMFIDAGHTASAPCAAQTSIAATTACSPAAPPSPCCVKTFNVIALSRRRNVL